MHTGDDRRMTAFARLRPTGRRRMFVAGSLLLAVAGLAACAQPMTTMTDPVVTADEWTRLARMRVVFAHQSVGANVLSGVQVLAREAAATLPVAESRDLSAPGAIVHFTVGENEHPDSKLADFTRTLDAAQGDGPDVALLKFCYLDFTDGSDGAALAGAYTRALDALAARHPRTRFAAVTAPLTIAQTGPRVWAKKLLGRPAAGYASNVHRLEFNERLRQAYGPRGLLFDLAAIEAEGMPPQRHQGQPFESLNPAFTSDGGHLNAVGQRRAAARLVKFLAGLSGARS